MLSTALKFYKRNEIQKAIVEFAKNREIAVRYGDKFGKRPDMLNYSEEVVELAKQGMTSLHASEELWLNPNLLNSNMKKFDMKKLRIGWDIIIDVDVADWQLSKITAWLIVNALKEFGIHAISVKFSGNKGFHIGVPFESFPIDFDGLAVKNLFPEAPRNISAFLLDYISRKYIKPLGVDEFIFGDGLSRKFKISIAKLVEITGKSSEELAVFECRKCGKKLEGIKKEQPRVEFLCPKCESSVIVDEDKRFEICPKCRVGMEKISLKKSLCECGSNELLPRFNPLSVVEVDTILISSRHLFRMPYSLHEKSGLVSIPFNPEKILAFEKKFAQPEIVKISKHIFVDRKKAKKDEAKRLLEEAMRFGVEKEKKEVKSDAVYELLTEAIPEEFFPPCIKKILLGMKDGRKRALFILINFLRCVGWEKEGIEKRIREWNMKNDEPLKETIIVGHLRYHLNKQEKILPPNCDNKMYYGDMHMCLPDNLCKKVKNPVNYAIIRARIGKIRE